SHHADQAGVPGAGLRRSIGHELDALSLTKGWAEDAHVIALDEGSAVGQEPEDAAFFHAERQVGRVALDQHATHDADGRKFLGDHSGRENEPWPESHEITPPD